MKLVLLTKEEMGWGNMPGWLRSMNPEFYRWEVDYAAQKGIEQKDHFGEYQERNGSRKATETGSGDCS